MPSIRASLSHVTMTDNLQEEKAYQIFAPLDVSKYPRTNLRFRTTPAIQIQDARESIDTFALDVNGFQFLRRQHEDSAVLDAAVFSNKEDSNSILQYLQQLQTQLHRDLGAEKVVIYDWRVSSYHFAVLGC
ncbi:uncharacterized protein TrAtP1_010765 [Trichoderma atroviride]|uniref:uncharacterized protein n=1 Tax=Hypocrea atroviridis TaxID=63577 RepID=UPI00333130CD|nr:hypothetical protein TrAtP1_010765 [Trichoderma atroviride]